MGQLRRCTSRQRGWDAGRQGRGPTAGQRGRRTGWQRRRLSAPWRRRWAPDRCLATRRGRRRDRTGLVRLVKIARHADIAWRGWRARWLELGPRNVTVPRVRSTEALPTGQGRGSRYRQPIAVMRRSHGAKLGSSSTDCRGHHCRALGWWWRLDSGCPQRPLLGASPEARLGGGPCHPRGLARERRARPATASHRGGV